MPGGGGGMKARASMLPRRLNYDRFAPVERINWILNIHNGASMCALKNSCGAAAK